MGEARAGGAIVETAGGKSISGAATPERRQDAAWSGGRHPVRPGPPACACPHADRRAFGSIVARYETPLLRYARQLVPPQEAEDLVQEAFLRIHRHLSTPEARPVTHVASWVFRIAHNLALDWHRRKRVRDGLQEQAVREAAQGADETPEGLAAMLRRAACERAVEELAKLPDQQRHVLLLKVIQEMSLREVGVVTGMTVGNVAYHVNAGLRELARRLKAAGVV